MNSYESNRAINRRNETREWRWNESHRLSLKPLFFIGFQMNERCKLLTMLYSFYSLSRFSISDRFTQRECIDAAINQYSLKFLCIEEPSQVSLTLIIAANVEIMMISLNIIIWQSPVGLTLSHDRPGKNFFQNTTDERRERSFFRWTLTIRLA